MVVRTTVEVHEGRAVVRRVALGSEAESLRASAEALIAAAGPGVLAVVRSRPVDDGWELLTEHGGLPVDAHRLRTAVAVRELGAAVAAVLARLHHQGRTHGRLEAEHVLIGSDGRPVLTELGPAGGSPAGDVASLADVLLRLVAALPATTERRERATRAQLHELLTGVGAAGGDRAPTARQLGAALGSVTFTPAAAAHRPSRRGVVAVLTAAGAVLALALAVALPRGPAPSAGGATAGDPTTTTAGPPPPSLPPCVVAQGASPAGCPHAVVVHGTTVAVDGHRAGVGRRGDEVLVADWGCEGAPRPAVLRPATGEILVFGPLEGGAPVVVLAERVEGATALSAELDGHGCAALLVVTPDGVLRLT